MGTCCPHTASTTSAVISQSGKRLGTHVVETSGQALVAQIKAISGKKHVPRCFRRRTARGRWACSIVTLAELESILRGVLATHDEIRFGVLFGSCVTRGPEAARDVDLALAFSATPSLMEVATLELELECSAGKPVDVVDVDQASNLLRWEIVRTGRDLLARDAGALLAFRARVPIEYADLRPYLDREAAGLRRVLAGSRR